jgi:hypothetical protein
MFKSNALPIVNYNMAGSLICLLHAFISGLVVAALIFFLVMALYTSGFKCNERKNSRVRVGMHRPFLFRDIFGYFIVLPFPLFF